MPDRQSPSDSGFPAWPTSAIDINLDELDGKLHEGVDLIGYRLTGQARLVHDLSSHNFISCVFDGVYATDVDLTRCDFKDVLIRNSHFRRCKIQAATHSTCVYVASHFEECDFSNAAQTNCEFLSVRYERCQLSNLMTKSSRFTDAIFTQCTSKTHVFEGNVFLRTRFISTDLELRTITSNFGLKHELTEHARIRTARVKEPHRFIEADELRVLVSEYAHNPLALLSVLYFLEGNLLSGGKEVDRAFEIESWMRLARQPAAFAQLVESLTEFLVNAFEDDEVDAHKILLLHDITRQIIEASADDPAGYRMHLFFGGIHLALSRLVEEYLGVLADLVPQSRAESRVLANGPPSKIYYERELAEVLQHCGVTVRDARPHNSPTEVIFADLLPGGQLFLIALLLASFVRVELRAHARERLKPRSLGRGKRASLPKKAGIRIAKEAEFFELTAGMSTEAQRAYELRIKSLLPTTSIVVDLRLSVSTQLMHKLRTVIVRILQD
jgi:uncharacterized protein YjbI with pentapeptide repeats